MKSSCYWTVQYRLFLFLCKFQYFEVDKAQTVAVLLRRLCGLNPHYTIKGRSLLHESLKNMHLCNYGTLLVLIDVVKTLLNTEFNVNAADCHGNTPLHLAVTLMHKAMPKVNEIYLFTNLLKVLSDGVSHQDFVNHHGKTAMDLAKTDRTKENWN